MHDLEKYKQLVLPVLQRYLIKHAAFFGSLAKGTMTDQSDIDLLIEPDSNFTLFNLLRLEDEISAVTQRKTDIVEYSAIKPSIKDEVLDTAISIL